MKPGSYLLMAAASGYFTLFAASDVSATQQFAAIRGPSTVIDFSASASIASPFVREQLKHTRVREARVASESNIEQMFEARGISFPAAEMYLRVFKWERTMELWVRSDDKKKFELLKTYDICALAGMVGPKRRKGDMQVPEGFYNIDLFNPASSYHLSMRIDYPNQRDRAANKSRLPLGGDIYIHGGCKSAGCLAITNEGIQELYWISVMTRANGQEQIPVHIFPARFDNEDVQKRIKGAFGHEPQTLEFWASLKPAYDYFKKHKRVPEVSVDEQALYTLSGSVHASR
jgi:murein L,D-transpeptidase YafK